MAKRRYVRKRYSKKTIRSWSPAKLWNMFDKATYSPKYSAKTWNLMQREDDRRRK